MIRQERFISLGRTWKSNPCAPAVFSPTTILGEAALTDTDKLYAKFADAFERRYVSQGYNTDRSIDETLEIGWELLAILPEAELKRIRIEFIEKYHPAHKSKEA